VRLPNVFTAMADIFLGFALTHGSLEPVPQFLMLLAASVCHYWAGMIFNDVFDKDVDLRERPLRPIPSGRVSVKLATTLGIVLNIVGIGLAAAVGLNSFYVALALSAAIYLYDGPLKRTPLGPVAMGSCRFFNVLLGASAMPVVEGELSLLVQALHVAAGLGVYVAGLTWFAKQEAKWSNRGMLVGAAVVINLGLAILLGFILNVPTQMDRSTPMILLAVITLTVVRRLVTAIIEPAPDNVQLAIKIMLLSLVMLDAMLVVFTTGQPVLGVMTAALLVPAFVLAKWIPMT
jgi:4-hydroxybenzoate polyprenyltransferase